MSDESWYRKTTWSAQDRLDFFDRLRRSRPPNRAQYLKIQAHYLVAAGTGEWTSAALELLDRALEESPDTIFQAEILVMRGQCLNRLGRLPEAESALRAALEQERLLPQVQAGAPVAFGTFVIERELRRLYEEALAVLHASQGRLLFPAAVYHYYAVEAILQGRLGSRQAARASALKALEAAGQTESGLPDHPGIGLVDRPDPRILAELQSLVD